MCIHAASIQPAFAAAVAAAAAGCIADAAGWAMKTWSLEECSTSKSNKSANFQVSYAARSRNALVYEHAGKKALTLSAPSFPLLFLMPLRLAPVATGS